MVRAEPVPFSLEAFPSDESLRALHLMGDHASKLVFGCSRCYEEKVKHETLVLSKADVESLAETLQTFAARFEELAETLLKKV